MNNKRFIKLLESIKMEIDASYENAKLDDVELNVKDKKLTLKVTFPNCLPVHKMDAFNKEFKNKLIESGLCKSCHVTYLYENSYISPEMLSDYYSYTLNLLKAKNVLFRALENFKVSFNDNKVELTCASEDKENIESLFLFVKKSISVLGLSFVEFIIKEDDCVKSIIQTIEDASKKEFDIAKENARSSIPSVSDNKEKEKTYKPKKKNTHLNDKLNLISEIPSTDEEIIDYTQRFGNSYFLIEGKVTSHQVTVTKTGYKIFQATVADKSGSIVIKTFINQNSKESEEYYNTRVTTGNIIRVYGCAAYDSFTRDVVVKIFEIISKGIPEKKKTHFDNEKNKRVELHAHSKMTFLDSVLSLEDYVARAVDYGHEAIALTDKNTVQGLGEFDKLCKKYNIKPIYGIEANYVNSDYYNPAFTVEDIPLNDATFVVYDIETTGINVSYNEIIEIGAQKIYHGQVIDTFSSLINPRRVISEGITNLTHITNDDVRNAPFIEDVLPKFLEFIDGAILVGHNVSFDNGHIYHNIEKLGLGKRVYPTIDTLTLAKAKYNSGLKKFGLEDLVKYFNITLDGHHRASNDAIATAEIFIKMWNDLLNDGITNYNQINSLVDEETIFKTFYSYHVTMLALNRTGLVNINRLVSDAHCNHFYKTPRFLKGIINQHREGILVGSSCVHGEVFETALNKDFDELLKVMEFYDYIEVQPVSCYSSLIEKKQDEMTEGKIRNVISKIIKAAGVLNKMVVATGDIHELDASDRVYRAVVCDKPLIGGGIHDLNGLENLPDTHYRNTEEMLSEFAFLGENVAYEIVVTNTNKIANMVETFNLFPKKLFAPEDDFMKKFGVPSAVEDLKRITYEVAHGMYGNPLPQIVSDRLDKELGSIIKNSFGTIYYIAYLLVKHSRDAGYVVGSRGSVGSSLVATFMRITEVNSLAPHYVCPQCHFSAFKYTEEEEKKYVRRSEEIQFIDILNSVDSGLDLPPCNCPICNTPMKGDGCNIPFETFLGFEGDKTPDIDLNFSGEYQSRAHDFCREIFGVENTFRGGTIGTIAERTAKSYIRDYYAKRGKILRSCEVDSMAGKITGIKRQTGQHPGGIVVVPEGVDVNEITPVQYPADDITSEWKTTHVDYHKFEENLLKLDILGHDDPTMVRYLMNFVDENPNEFPFTSVENIPIFDPNVLKMFNGIEVLGVKEEDVLSRVGTTGLPEFGTNLTKNMCEEVRPKTISDLIRISGLSHGTNVWSGNARDYFLGLKEGYDPIPISKLICCRDDIMGYLISKGIPAKVSFKIMEAVRKGRKLTDEFEKIMREHHVEEWYIDCCKKIEYLFPKAHATAYVIMALRIAWFKFYKPLYYYSGFFSKRTDQFEVDTLQKGYDAIKARVLELDTKYGNQDLTENEEQDMKQSKSDLGDMSDVKQKKLLVGLRVALEMCARGYSFLGVDINKSDAVNFTIEGNSLRIPFVAVDSLGESTAKTLVERRGNHPFTSMDDASRRGKISKSLFDKLFVLGAFKDLPKEDKVGLFKFLDDFN